MNGIVSSQFSLHSSCPSHFNSHPSNDQSNSVSVITLTQFERSPMGEIHCYNDCSGLNNVALEAVRGGHAPECSAAFTYLSFGGTLHSTISRTCKWPNTMKDPVCRRYDKWIAVNGSARHSIKSSKTNVSYIPGLELRTEFPVFPGGIW